MGAESLRESLAGKVLLLEKTGNGAVTFHVR
jgi:hypothetical protein